MKNNVVLKISGKWLSPENSKVVTGYVEILKKIKDKGVRLAVIVGGGSTARNYIDVARAFNVSESWLDLLGIESSRLNALLLVSLLQGYVHPKIPQNIKEFIDIWYTTDLIVICGGFQPGQSTTSVAALIAEAIGSKLIINAARVDGVYDKDPTKYSDAKKFNKITLSKLEKILSTSSSFKAGGYEVIDPLTINILKRAKIRMRIVYGGDPLNVLRVLEGKEIGTLIIPE